MSHRASSFPADATIPRESNRRGLWPWLLAAGPVAVVLASLASAWIAMRNDDGLVAEDYYKRGLLINRKLAQESSLAPRIAVELDIDAEGRVRAHVDGTLDPVPESILLHLGHPGDPTHAQAVTLRRAEPGVYVGSVQVPSQGRWLVTLEAGEWRLPTTTVAGPLGAIRLRSAEPD